MNKLICVTFSLAVIIIVLLLYMPNPLPPETGSAGGGINEWLEIEKPNQLDVIFPGQIITFSLRNSSEKSICVSEYGPWSPLYEVDFKDNTCYDLDRGVAGPCNDESDMKITDSSIEFINNATITMFITSYMFFGNSVPPRGSDYFKYAGIFSRVLYRFTEDYSIHLYMKTANNSIKLWAAPSHDKIIYSIEQRPQEWRCHDSGSVSISSDDLMEGDNGLAFKTPDSGYVSYSIFKTDNPYITIHNPNLRDLIFPEKETNAVNMTLYDYIIIRAEYTDNMDRFWCSCDDGPWESRPAGGRYVETFITSDFCKEDGKHNISFMVEYQRLNTSMKTYAVLRNTKRPSANVSLSLDAAEGYLNVNVDYHSPNNIGEMPEPMSSPIWYKNNLPIENFRTSHLDLSLVSVEDNNEIRATYYPIDFTGLGGEQAHSEPIKITGLPPFARGIIINPEIIYPDTQVSAKGIYFGLSSEGESEYMWYVNGNLSGEGSQIKLTNMNEGDVLTAEYIPVDSSGRAGSPARKTMKVTIDENYHMSMAIVNYDTSFCEGIGGSKEAALCIEGVETGSQDCNDRPLREKLFCLAFLTKDTDYCNYIDIDWYRSNCLTFVGGNPEECMNLDEDIRDSCILEFASSSGNQELCVSITNSDMRILCNALANKNPGICSQIADSAMRERCASDASYK